MAESIKIKLNIAGRHYPMSVSPEEEQTIREAGKIINDIVKNFEHQYQTRDKQDALAMCSLQIAVKTLQLEKEDVQDSTEFNNQIQELISKIQQVV
ncbi:cell division protein ZapA [Flavobacteriaceae bacterium Ap0902]|nr:cell division protein ZapA [Flavobacteriaceae bacterium Ap0902]